ncbi:ribose 5-phosphate isomerase B [Alicyclobacillus sp. SO9]|uniref:ribose 5-phosphate isomerase B n=1 Tax=Alicyclobacillus sp. SO9 TaxID=2665646 RepID=UPI0018E8EE7E|nr:ribose 5-phosphate isomerase B [Alicyclobacillus sp. SO9]QQE78802.1 ribose 5-phosphate isomerase B [Alicyclobacillus sp. SO9]
MKVGIGSDHAGYRLKKLLLPMLEKEGFELTDVGTYSEDSVDYPDFAVQVAKGVASGEYDRGVLICGTGLGMAISANKVSGIRAVTVHDTFSAEMARRHNNATVMTMGERVIGPGLAAEIVKVFLTTEFEGGRHQRRVDKMTEIERQNLDATC